MTDARRDYVDQIRRKLDKLDTKIVELEQEYQGDGNDEMQREFHKALQEIRASRDDVRLQLEELQTTGTSTWDEIKQRVERAWTSMSRAVDKAGGLKISRDTPQRSGDPQSKDRTRTDHTAKVAQIRERARRHIADGAVTDAYPADRDAVLASLNDALATEIVCMLRYKRHYFMATGLEAEAAAQEFLEHASEELEHADSLAARIVQLGGEPDFAPSQLAARSHAEYVPGNTLDDMLRENLVAERIAIDTYGQMIRFVGDDDPTTRRLLEGILAKEEEHADDLASLLGDSAPSHSAQKQ